MISSISFVVILAYSGLFEVCNETTKLFETPEETIERYDDLIEDNIDAKWTFLETS